MKKLCLQTNNALLSPPCTHYRRRSSVMFSDVVLLHGSNSIGNALQAGTAVSSGEKNVCSSEKMTQTGDGNVWSSPLPDHIQVFSTAALQRCRVLPTHFHWRVICHVHVSSQMQAELGGNEAMTCQELLALSGALSAALPTGQLALDSFLNSLTKGKFFLFIFVFCFNSFSLKKIFFKKRTSNYSLYFLPVLI